jgi:nitrite reductase/ring-hydroxylating ferredoxin subunit/uncharacterized membrane protein
MEESGVSLPNINVVPGTGDLDSQKSQEPASRLIESFAQLEERLQKQLDKALYAGGSPAAQRIRNFLNGTWLGEPLHVVLTDVPVGAWTAAMVFDALSRSRSGREFARAADASIAIGLAGALGAAAAGVTDWSDVDPPARRRGLIHGLLNLSATALFATSLIQRKRGRSSSRRESRSKASHAAGRLSATLGYAVMAYAAHLGGKMVYENRVGVDRTAGQPLPRDFVAVLAESDLEENKPTRAMLNGVRILLVRRGERLFAMAETCSHFSGPLAEGKLEGDSIVCPLHNSRFALDDGRVLDGPAVHPQPCLDARVRGGQIEVRARGGQ